MGHATNNGVEDPWSRFAFTGDRASDLPTFATVPLLLAEAVVLVGIVALDRLRQRRRGDRRAPVVTANPYGIGVHGK